MLHPLWDDHAILGGGEKRDAEEWIAVLCDVAPTLHADGLLTYLELVANADVDGRVDVRLDEISQRVLDHVDRIHLAHTIVQLRRLDLPDAESTYRAGMHGCLVMTLSVHDPPRAAPSHVNVISRERADSQLVNSMVTHGVASLHLVRYGAGFGPDAMPRSFMLERSYDERCSW